MSYTCRLYKNSGFNASNTPDTPALLNTVPNYLDVPALEVLQPNLGSIRVKATWDQVVDVDFCRLSDGTEVYYYAVDGAGIVMQATDVAELPLTLDYILTYGVKGGILDGETERVHVSDDGYGLYNADDPFLTPELPMIAVSDWIKYDSTAKDQQVIESTLNPIITANQKGATVYSDEGDSVTVPKALPNERYTLYNIPGDGGAERYTFPVSPGTCLYGEEINKFTASYAESLATLRSLGLDQAIIRQFIYPAAFISVSKSTMISQYKDSANNSIRYDYIAVVSGRQIDQNFPNNQDYNFEAYTVKNNRINYSNLTKFGIMTCSGESLEGTPVEVKADSQTGTSRPQVRCISDPHTDGKPYFRFRFLNNNDTDFYRNCIAGMKWKEVPLIFTGTSGSALNVLKFNASQAISYIGNEREQYNYGLQQLQNTMQIGREIANIPGYILEGKIGDSIIGIGQAAQNTVNTRANQQFSQIAYRAQRLSDIQDITIQNSIAVPTVNFPYNSELLRDIYNNGIMCYRYKYNAADVKRIDKLLTMYGYRHSKALELSDFSNRKYFNYVMCNNISVTGHPKWINDGIAEQLKAGIRMWHVLPNPSYYDDNPIKEA